MDWHDPRAPLNLSINNFKHHTPNSNNWRKIRQKVIKHYNNECRYCGGTYNKYLTCFDLNDQIDDHYEISCKLCNYITHLNYGFFEDITLCFSKMHQLEIVRLTVDFILKYNRIPKILEIDKHAKKINLSILEFINILIANDNKKIKGFQNYKIFFTENLDISFLINKNSTNYMFIDDYDFESNYQVQYNNESINVEEGLDIHEMSLDEKKTIDKYLKPKNYLENKLDYIMETVDNSLNDSHKRIENTEFQHFVLTKL